MVKTTSWQAYQEILRGGVAVKQAEKVLQTINYYPSGVSRATIARAMGMPINAVCGKCPVTGRTVEMLKVVEY